MTTTKYAIRITPDNLALIHVLRPIVHVEVKEDRERFFLFTVDTPETTTDHDIVQKDNLMDYDGDDKAPRRIIF